MRLRRGRPPTIRAGATPGEPNTRRPRKRQGFPARFEAARRPCSLIGLYLLADAEVDLLADNRRIELLVIEHRGYGRLDSYLYVLAFDDLILRRRGLDDRH